MSDPLREAADRFEDLPALVYGDQRLTFRAWSDTADRLALPSDEVVGLVAEPTVAFALAFGALWRAGKTIGLLARGDPRERDLLQSLGASRIVDALEPGSARPASPGPAATGEARIVVFTSGSLGRPRPVIHSVATLIAAARGSLMRVPFEPGDRWAMTLPLQHVGGLAILFRSLVGGGAVHFGDWRRLLTENPTHASLVAPQLEAIAGPGALRAVLVGGGATPLPILERALARGIPVLPTYGSTEMGSQIATVAPPARADDLGTAGTPLPHVTLRLEGDGEISVRGPSLALGVLGAGPLAEGDGFYRTGDLGRFDGAGRLVVLGRKDLTFVSGGEKVRPQEVELALLALPGVREAVVVPVRHPRWGSRPVAWVAADDVVGLREALLTRLPRWLVPDHVVPLPSDCPGRPGKRDRRWLETRALLLR